MSLCSETFCFGCLPPYKNSLLCYDKEHPIYPFKGNYTCSKCEKSFLNEDGSMCKCSTYCSRCIPARDRT